MRLSGLHTPRVGPARARIIVMAQQPQQQPVLVMKDGSHFRMNKVIYCI